MTQNEYDKWYRGLNETQKEVTDEFFAWKEKASKGKDGYADIVITMINGKAEVAIREGEYISPFRGFQMDYKHKRVRRTGEDMIARKNPVSAFKGIRLRP